MTKILFVCHGNICRSPMAEFCLKDMAARQGAAGRFEIESAATSREELGNPVYPPARRKLLSAGIGTPDNELGVSRKRSRLLTKADYGRFDLIICMERYNVRNALRILGSDPEGKIHLLMEYADGADAGEAPRDVADPWYTGDFDEAWQDVRAGCEGLLKRLQADGRYS